MPCLVTTLTSDMDTGRGRMIFFVGSESRGEEPCETDITCEYVYVCL